jgi:hypothetical protein
MSKRPGHVDVTTEVGYCNFCGRTRNLRSEAHRLGELVRTIVTCETCHRTISNSIGVAPAEPEPQPAAPARKEDPALEAKAQEKPQPKRRAPAKRAPKAAAAKPKTPPKPRSTATRRTAKKKP